MAIDLLLDVPGGRNSPDLTIRPGKSNAFPMTVSATGTVAGDLVDVYVNQTQTDETAWQKLFTLTIVAGVAVSNFINDPYDRLRVHTQALNAGTVRVFLEPGA